MYTLQQVKDIYYWELANLDVDRRTKLDEYIREHFISVYELSEDSESIDLVGYNRKLESRCWL